MAAKPKPLSFLKVILAPGFGGTENQPLLMKLDRRLSMDGASCLRMSFDKGRPIAPYERELKVLDEVRPKRGAVALVGRSFGGRMCIFSAVQNPPRALVVLGHPIGPPGRPRPLDEEALSQVSCPTLIVQGSDDDLGPLKILRRIARKNSHVRVEVLRGVGHELGRKTSEALELTAAFLADV
jgi:predicted alpha/beta-hydrolase family hydrolase